MEAIIFSVVAAVAVASGIGVVIQRRAMYSALLLVANFFCLAVLYILLGAYFIAAVQVAVYAGAVMVLMLFVIMLLDVGHPEPLERRFRPFKPLGMIAAVAFLALAILVALNSQTPARGGVPDLDNITAVATALYTRYLLPFEVTSVLLLAAILGAVVIAHKREVKGTSENGAGRVLLDPERHLVHDRDGGRVSTEERAHDLHVR
jgi:NADH-quinone oxidoreductase subunit J